MSTYKIVNLPNLFTLSRVLLIPIVYLLLQSGEFIAGLLVLIFSLFTDLFDGKIARYLNQCTPLGAILDPIADKVVVLTYISLIYTESEILPFWFVFLVFARNIAQLLSIPILMWWLKKAFFVKPKMLPKYGTTLNFIIMIAAIFQIYGADHLSFELNQYLFTALKWFFIPVSSYLELHILVTYLPRLYQIATDRHDTFE